MQFVRVSKWPGVCASPRDASFRPFKSLALRTRGTAIKFVSLLVALVLVWSCAVGGAAAQQTPASPTPTPAQPPARTGRSYDAAPVRRPQPSAPQAPSPVNFSDVTAQSRVNFRHAASPTSQKYLPETMSGGVAMFDYDNDGRLDLFFTNGARLTDPMPAGAQADKRDPRFWNRLYRQKADGTFEDVTEHAGLQGAGYSMGLAAADFDGDGWTDLYVTAYGGNTLYRNRGDGTFEDVTKRLGVAASGWSTSAGWFDYDRDGRLDLFVARYMDWDFERGSLLCGDPRERAYCHPDNFKGVTNILFHQKADGTFEDVSARARVADPRGKGLGVAFADFDNDGFTDIVVANDSVRQSLYHNRGDGTFEDVAVTAGVGYDENGKAFAGMGVDAADYDDDGWPDIFMTALSNETYPLFRNNGDLSFIYATGTTGVSQITQLYSGWGARFADFDNDGRRDIFVAQGHVLDTIEKTTGYLTYRQGPLLMRNTGKGFVNVSASAGLTAPLAARGAAFGDLDNDGDTDVVIGQTDGPPVILRNNGTKNHWLGLVLAGAKGNRQALGARVKVTDAAGGRQIFDVSQAGSYLSSNDPRLLVGLSLRDSVRSVEVRWPDGRTQTVNNPPVDKYLTISEQR
ncbi:MAG: enediyne biosynthesis protein [Acidobacteriota bacterium]|nr:enediyne biosynthesis protein [Acidobacteriota bacterium]